MRKCEALRYRQRIETAVQSLPDGEALDVVTLHPEWAADTAYSTGYKVQHGGKLWRCREPGHTSQAGWEPSTDTASLWEEICESHAGTLDDPIPYRGNMALTSGLYYIQDYAIYRCSRDTGIPVYNRLAELVGIYVETV